MLRLHLSHLMLFRVMINWLGDCNIIDIFAPTATYPPMPLTPLRRKDTDSEEFFSTLVIILGIISFTYF